MIQVLAAGRAAQTAQVLAAAGSASAPLQSLVFQSITETCSWPAEQLPQRWHGLTLVHLVSRLSGYFLWGMMLLL